MAKVAIQFDQGQVNLGNASVALGLEDRILANGILPNSSLPERASIVRGILDGLLATGRWEVALLYVYGQGPVRSLFDGDFEGFNNSVLEAIKRQRDVYIDDGVARVMLEKWPQEQLYQLALLIDPESRRNRDGLNIHGAIARKLTDDDKRKDIYGMLARSALEARDYGLAHEHFSKAGDRQGVDSVYDALLKERLQRDYLVVGGDNLKLLIDIAVASETPELARDRLARITRKVIGEGKGGYDFTENMMRIYEAHKTTPLPISDEEEDGLVSIVVEDISRYGIEEIRDTKLLMKWALMYADSEAAQAYALFQRLNYEGPERLAAARKAVVEYEMGYPGRSQVGLNVNQLATNDLEAIFDSLPLQQKARAAKHLGRKDALLGLSRESFGEYQDMPAAKRREKGRWPLVDAYQLWIEGGGAHDDPYVQELRQKLIQDELSGSWYLISHSWLKEEDRIGHIEAFNATIAIAPIAAYETAKRVKDEDMMQTARISMVAKSPEDSFKYFTRRPEERDESGAALALTALSNKYQVSQDRLLEVINIPAGDRR